MPHPTPWADYLKEAKEIFTGAELSEKGVAVGHFLGVDLPKRVGGHQRRGRGQHGKGASATRHGKKQATNWTDWIGEVQAAFKKKHPNHQTKSSAMYSWLGLKEYYNVKSDA
jgi:hypothetical protein